MSEPGQGTLVEARRPRRSRRYRPWDFMVGIDDVCYDRARQLEVLRRIGRRPVDLSSGVLACEAPSPLTELAAVAVRLPAIHADYEGPAGSELALQALAGYSRQVRGVELQSENVVLASGVALLFHYVALMCVRRFGECEAIVAVPTFPQFAATLLAQGVGVREVFAGRAEGFLPAPEALAEAIGPTTRLLYVNLYNNPTGETYTHAEFAQLLQLADAEDLLLIVDEVTLDFSLVEGEQAPDALALAAELGCLEHVLVLSGLSKDRSLPGLRIGWAIGDAGLVRELVEENNRCAITSSGLAGVVVFADMLLRALDAAPSEAARRTVTEAFLDAAGPCLELSPGIEPVLARLRNAGTTDLAERYSRWRRELMDRLAANLDVLREWLQRRGAQWIEPLGGFNLFCRLPELDGFAPTRFAHELFEESGVITLPAPAFGLDERRWEEQGFWLRLTFSMERDQLVTALRAIDAFCQRRS